MKLQAIIILLSLSIALGIIADFMLPSRGVKMKSAAALERLEELAFKKEGSAELRSAVGDLRDVEKRLFVEEALQWVLQICGVAASTTALGLCIVCLQKKKEPNSESSVSQQPTQDSG